MTDRKDLSEEETLRAIADHIDGWCTSTFAWQEDPDPAVEERNRLAAARAHTGECLRRIRDVLSAARPVEVQQEPSSTIRNAAYSQIDRFLRNNLDDADYADYSQALDLIYGAD